MSTKIFLASLAVFALLLAGCPGEAEEGQALPHPEVTLPGAEAPVEEPAEEPAAGQDELPPATEPATEPEEPVEGAPPAEEPAPGEADEGSELTGEELASLFDIEISEAPEDFEYGKAPGEE